MSCESDDLRGCLTELEIQSGVSSLMYGLNEEEADERGGNDNGIDSGWLKGAAKNIAGLESTKRIKQRLVHKLMRDGIDHAISRYLEYERVPAEYRSIVKSSDCIETMVKGIFYKVCGIRHSDFLNIEISDLCAELKINESLTIVYDRVGLVQKFVHSKVDEFCGDGFHGAIPVKHMRNLLSVARLHLYLSDFQSKKESYPLYMDEQSWLASELECHSPKATTLPAGKRFIPSWRVRHLKPLANFYPKLVRSKIDRMRKLDEGQPLDEFAEAALKIYATLCY